MIEKIKAARAQAQTDAGRAIELRAKLVMLQDELAEAEAVAAASKAAAIALMDEAAEPAPLEIKTGMAVCTPQGAGTVVRMYGENCAVLLNKRDRKGKETIFNFSVSELANAKFLTA